VTSGWPSPLHPLQRRYLCEDLVRRRRADEPRRTATPQRAARVDPNPHQVEAVVFALARLREGGCILADEVGLGKTIEAGLVIAQLLAEGARRVLLVTPKSLLGQWRQELYCLFNLSVHEARPVSGGFDGEGIFLINREGVGSEGGRAALDDAAPFDLCVIDEAHEVFAGLYKRFDRFGTYDDASPVARTAGRLREVLIKHHTPVLLLTATPIQNNLAELWGLVQFVDQRGTLLGDLPTFRELFCGEDDRQLAKGQEHELRLRLRQVLQRTLRRQAQAFLEQPFVDRQARLFSYEMSGAERALYDDVTRYLLEPSTLAFQGKQRQLLLLGFHRRMASSTAALAASLERVAARLARLAQVAPHSASDSVDQAGSPRAASRGAPANPNSDADLLADFAHDLDDDAPEELDQSATDAPVWATPAAAAAELARVEGFVTRARAAANDDSKFRALAAALAFIDTARVAGKDSGKLVIFTESLITQAHVRAQLLAHGLVTEDEVTLFRGTNDSPRAKQALERWRTEVTTDGPAPSPDVAVRLALVHEFKTRSRVFISTEAGAKGLNLQFCSAVVNYDLPWNPQRIEQRIGRCHRYGQRHPVTVINFLAQGNEAQQLTFDILSQKLELFGTVLDASDQVLHSASGPSDGVLVGALGAAVENELRRIYDRAHSLQEVTAELRALRDRVGHERARFEETHQRTASLIASHLDDDVARVFAHHRDALPAALAELDCDLAQVVTAWLDARGLPYTLSGGALRTGDDVAAIDGSTQHLPLHPGHPLVLAAVADARATPVTREVVVSCGPKLKLLRGKRGRLRLLKLAFDGFEQVERLLPVFVLDGGGVLDASLADEVLHAPMRHGHDTVPMADDPAMDDAVDEQLFLVQREVDLAEHERFERASQQADRFLEDRILVLRRRQAAATAELDAATARREGAQGAESRTAAEQALATAHGKLESLDAAITQLVEREDDTWRRHQAHNERRRYAPPRRDLLLDVSVRFEPAGTRQLTHGE
jgi:hypothetical protein